MARPHGLIRYYGTEGNVTTVNSMAYGDHTRARRKPGMVNNVLQEETQRNVIVARIAKSIKDPLEPFRENFKDGTLWSRLQSLIRKQFRQHRTFDWTSLIGFEFFEANKLHNVIHSDVEVSFTGGKTRTLHIKVSSKINGNVRNKKVTHYQHSLIGLLLDKNLKPTLLVESKMFPGVHDTFQNHIVEWPIKSNTSIVLIAVKAELYKNDEALLGYNVKGFMIMAGVDFDKTANKINS